MDIHFIFERVKEMKPSSFSDEEQHCYLGEKMMLRQFLLMKQQDQVPDHLSVRDMKNRLLKGRTFLEEFQESFRRTDVYDTYHLFKAELAWTTARHFCLAQMEQELMEELEKERQLSQLLGRKVTLEGLQMFLSIFRPKAEEDINTFLAPLHRQLLRRFGGIVITLSPFTEGDAKPAKLLELEKRATVLVPAMVDTVIKFLLEEPEGEKQTKLASAEIYNLLTDSVSPCLYGSISERPMFEVCSDAARSIFETICSRFDEVLKSYHMMDYDESHFSAREGVMSAIEDMDQPEGTDGTSEVQEERQLEKREASPQVTATEEPEVLKEKESFTSVFLDEETPELNINVTEDTSRFNMETTVIVFMDDKMGDFEQDIVQDKSLVRDSAVQIMTVHEDKSLSSTESVIKLSHSEVQEDRQLEKREASPQVTATEEPEVLKEKESFTSVFLDEETPEMTINVTEDTSLVNMDTNIIVFIDDLEKEVVQEESLLWNSAVGIMTVPKVKSLTSTQSITKLSHSEVQEHQHLEKREASPQFTATDEPAVLIEREAFTSVCPDKETPEMTTEVTEDTSVLNMETNVIVFTDDRPDKLEKEVVQEESLVQDSAVKIMTVPKVKSLTSTQSITKLSHSEVQEDQHLEKREASPKVTATEEPEVLIEKDNVTSVCPDNETPEMTINVTEDTSLVNMDTNVIVFTDDKLDKLEQEESLVRDSAIQIMTVHKVKSATFTNSITKLSHSEVQEDQHLEKREASPQVTATEMPAVLIEKDNVTSVCPDKETPEMTTEVTEDTSLVNMDTNVIVFIDNKLDKLGQELAQEESLVLDTAVQIMTGHEVKSLTESVTKLSHSEVQEHQHLEKREASPQFTATDEPAVLIEMEAFASVCPHKETPEMTTEVTKDTSLVNMDTNVFVFIDNKLDKLEQDVVQEESLNRDLDVQIMTVHKVKSLTESVTKLSHSEVQEHLHLEKREASPQFTATEEPEVPMEKDHFTIVCLHEETPEIKTYVTEDLEQEESLVQEPAVQIMKVHKVKSATSTKSISKLSTSEMQQHQHLEKREASPQVTVDEDVAITSSDAIKNTFVVIIYMSNELQALEQEEMEPKDTQKSLVQHCDANKKKGVKAFFRGCWRKMTGCFSVSTLN